MKTRVIKVDDRYYPQGRYLGGWKYFSPGFLYESISFKTKEEAIEFCEGQNNVVWKS